MYIRTINTFSCNYLYRSINIFGCRDKQGDICNFVDLPGYGYAKISKAMQEEVAQFIMQYLENRTSLRLAVVLVDIRRTPQEADQQTLQVVCTLSTSKEKRFRFYNSKMLA